VKLRSFKLRFHDGHVRILPAAFDGPGVDVRKDDALACFDLAKPMMAWLLAREPSVTVRAMSVDLETRRVIVSFEDLHATTLRGPRPMVLRIDPPESTELLERAGALVDRLAVLAQAAIERRR
jgi:hypothetical protein